MDEETKKRFDSIEKSLDEIIGSLNQLHSLVVAIETGDVNLKKGRWW